MQTLFYVAGDQFSITKDAEWITLRITGGETVNHVNPFTAWSKEVQTAALEALTGK